MHIPRPPELQLYLIARTKDRYGPFRDLEAVYSFMRACRLDVSAVADDDMVSVPEENGFIYPVEAYTIRTDNGSPVPARLFSDLTRQQEKERWAKTMRILRRRNVCRPEHFRRMPVAGTSKRRGGGGYLRNVRTFAEHRAASAAEADGQGRLVRKARSTRNLPEAWDDIWRQNQRSWKKHRRRQWRGQPGGKPKNAQI